uniref:Protein S100 n=1 Tax=Gadus morhua TaxID=8049 RepID=A0A8C5BX92_GADMO
MQDPTAMEAGLAILYGTFVKYASGEDDNDPTTISKKELAKLLEEQLPHLGGKEMLDCLMKNLDADKDGTLNFMEYCAMVTTLSMCLHMACETQCE